MTAATAPTENSSTTPILDRLLPLPPSLQARRKKVSLGGFLIGCLIGLAVAVFIIWSLETQQPLSGPIGWAVEFVRRNLKDPPSGDTPGWLLLWRPIAALLALYAVVVVHEVGHVALGILSGFRLLFMGLGPFSISPPLRIRWRPKNPVPGSGGLAALIPNHSQKLRGRAIVMLLGGPVANLATGFAWGFFGTEPGWFAGCFAGLSILIGLMNLVPFRRLALISDGKRIVTLLFNSRQGERWLAILQLVADLRNGIDPENLRPEFLAIATSIADASPDTVLAHNLAYAAAYYKHNDAEAARALEICLQYSGFVGPFFREAIIVDAVGFQAKRNRRMDLAQQWLGELPEKTIMPELRLNAETSILEGQGDVQGALKKLEEAEKIILTQADPDRRELSLKFLRRTRSELLQQTTPASAT